MNSLKHLQHTHYAQSTFNILHAEAAINSKTSVSASHGDYRRFLYEVPAMSILNPQLLSNKARMNSFNRNKAKTQRSFYEQLKTSAPSTLRKNQILHPPQFILRIAKTIRKALRTIQHNRTTVNNRIQGILQIKAPI